MHHGDATGGVVGYIARNRLPLLRSKRTHQRGLTFEVGFEAKANLRTARSLRQSQSGFDPPDRRWRSRRQRDLAESKSLVCVQPDWPVLRLLSTSLHGWRLHPSAPATGNHMAQAQVP